MVGVGGVCPQTDVDAGHRITDTQVPTASQLTNNQAEHVSDLGLEKASDREIWKRAGNLGSVIT